MKKSIQLFMVPIVLVSLAGVVFADYTNSGNLFALAQSYGKVKVSLSPKPNKHDHTELKVHTVKWVDGEAVADEQLGDPVELTNSEPSKTIKNLPKDTDLLITGQSFDKNDNVLRTYNRVIHTKKSKDGFERIPFLTNTFHNSIASI